MNFEIGTVIVTHSEEGDVLSASFIPHRKVDFDDSLLSQLKRIRTDNPEDIRNNTDLVLSGWFSKMTAIELADPSEYVLKSEVLECDKYPSGNIKKCAIKYIFKETKWALN